MSCVLIGLAVCRAVLMSCVLSGAYTAGRSTAQHTAHQGLGTYTAGHPSLGQRCVDPCVEQCVSLVLTHVLSGAFLDVTQGQGSG